MGCPRLVWNPVRSVLFLLSFLIGCWFPFSFYPDKHAAISSAQHFFLSPTCYYSHQSMQTIARQQDTINSCPFSNPTTFEARRPAERLRWPITITANSAVLSTEGWPIHLSDVVCAHYVAAAMAEWLRRWTRNPMGYSRTGSNPVRSVQRFSSYFL